MPKILLPLLLALALASCHDEKSLSPCPLAEQGIAVPEGVRLLGHTPVRDHGEASLSWIYGMLATMESRHIAEGDSVHLSTAYVVRMVLRERTLDYYRSGGLQPLDMDGEPERVPLLLEQYGLVPYDSYPDRENINYSVVGRKLVQLAHDALTKRRPLAWLTAQTDALLDHEMGLLPAPTVHLYRAEYTRQEFARSVCAPGEYRVLSPGPDITADSLLAYIERETAAGSPVCLETDQEAGHHVVPVLGSFRQDGTTYLVCQDAHGKKVGSKGLVAVSEEWVRRHGGRCLTSK